MLGTVEIDASAVRLMNPGEDIHQRALARAVLATERVNFTRAHVEAYVPQHRNTAERFAVFSIAYKRPPVAVVSSRRNSGFSRDCTDTA